MIQEKSLHRPSNGHPLAVKINFQRSQEVTVPGQ